MPPPLATELPDWLAELLAMVLPVTVRVPELSMPPPEPFTPTEFPWIVVVVTVSVPELSMPPPKTDAGVVRDGAAGDRCRAVVFDPAAREGRVA